MTSRKNIKIFDFNGVNVAKHWHVAGEVFAISDCLICIICSLLSSDSYVLHRQAEHNWGVDIGNNTYNGMVGNVQRRVRNFFSFAPYVYEHTEL